MAGPQKLQCRFCGTRVRTAKGLSSHTAQSPACRQKLNEVMPDSRRKKRSQTTTPSPEPEDSNVAAEMPYDDQPMDFDPPEDGPIPATEPQIPPAAGPRGVTIEEVEDEDAPGATRWFEDYPKQAGCVLDPEFNLVETVFVAIRRKQQEEGQAPWAPFDSEDDWNLARWLSKTGISGENIKEFLKLNKSTFEVDLNRVEVESRVRLDVTLCQEHI
ncbi:hypothetical protein B0H19DRAFT_1308284 [Mycena capillaripes]|nr:hypothetical protein B0H19DRAFT_1308284 [Mycena capillaripes]